MKAFMWLGLAIAAGASPCAAQQPYVPPSVAPGLHLTSYATSLLPSDLHFTTTTTGTVIAAPSKTPRTSRAADSKFFLLNGSFLGMAVFDVEMTQRCIADQHCRERNPFMSTSHAGQLGLNLGLVAGVSGASYWLKKHKSALWWLPPGVGIMGHAAGAATGIEHQ